MGRGCGRPGQQITRDGVTAARWPVVRACRGAARVRREGRPPVSDLASGRRQVPAVFVVIGGIDGYGVHQPFRQRHAEGSLSFPDEQAFG